MVEALIWRLIFEHFTQCVCMDIVCIKECLSAWLFVNFELMAYYKFQSLVYSLVPVFVHACVKIWITMQKVRQQSITHLNTILAST